MNGDGDAWQDVLPIPANSSLMNSTRVQDKKAFLHRKISSEAHSSLVVKLTVHLLAKDCWLSSCHGKT